MRINSSVLLYIIKLVRINLNLECYKTTLFLNIKLTKKKYVTNPCVCLCVFRSLYCTIDSFFQEVLFFSILFFFFGWIKIIRIYSTYIYKFIKYNKIQVELILDCFKWFLPPKQPSNMNVKNQSWSLSRRLRTK